MTMVPLVSQFTQDLRDLWANADENTTIYETGDLIQELWENSIVTGVSIVGGATVPPNATYPGLGPMAAQPPPDAMTAGQAAQAFETAMTTMCSGTVYTLTPPAVGTPPPAPIPGGPALPGVVKAALEGVFISGAQATEAVETAPQVAGLLAGFLAGWQLMVAIPPAGASPIPII